jgi:hypothetical protein
MSKERRSEIIVAAALDIAETNWEAPSVHLRNRRECDLYKSCLLAIKQYVKRSKELKRHQVI